jgi:hypothetical protein
MITIPKHLGGHANITHIDKGSLEYMKSILGITSLIDLGCGPMGQVKLAKELNIDAIGIDGDWNCSPDIVHDFTTGPFSEEIKADAIWSVEFLEHVEEKYLNNVLKIFNSVNCAILAAAPVGKGGYHHVNCQNPEYWSEKMNSIGFYLDMSHTAAIRKASTMKREFIRDRGMVFIKNLKI